MGKSEFAKLAGHGLHGAVYENPDIPKTIKIGNHVFHPQQRVATHEHREHYLENRKHNPLPHKQAHKLADKAEQKDMTFHEIEVYEGTLGAVARWSKKTARKQRPWHP